MTTSPASFDSGALDQLVAERVESLRARVSALGRPDVRIVAVTKGFGAPYVEAAVRAGIDTVGENYAQEFLAKHAVVRAPVRWNFLGTLQTNKIASLCAHADVLCALTREREIAVIARQPRVPSAYVEIDFTGAPTRSGAHADQLGAILGAASNAHVVIEGLMTVAPVGEGGARRAFAALAQLADQYGLRERSMGMSDDLDDALAAGSTEIRVGRALFGPRQSA